MDDLADIRSAGGKPAINPIGFYDRVVVPVGIAFAAICIIASLFDGPGDDLTLRVRVASDCSVTLSEQNSDILRTAASRQLPWSRARDLRVLYALSDYGCLEDIDSWSDVSETLRVSASSTGYRSERVKYAWYWHQVDGKDGPTGASVGRSINERSVN